VVLTDDQQAVWFQDASGFPVIALEIRDPHRDVAPGIDDIERRVAEA
jgi:hypothetical protein